MFIAAGQTLKDAALRLPSTGTVSGRVFDENGQPATGAPVQLLRPVYNTQGRNLQSVGTAVADDRGDYRIFGVPPGRYYLAAGNTPGPQPLRGAAGGGGPLSGPRFSLVFYPNFGEVDQASFVEVKSGGEASIDMHLQRQQLHRVRGRITNATGAALPANVSISLNYKAFSGGGSFSSGRSFDPVTGNFELQNVPPGDYTVTVQLPEQNPILQAGPIDATGAAARQAAQAARPSAQTPIHVADADVEGVVLTLSSAFSTTGRIVVEGQSIGSIANLERMRLSFQPPTPAINQTQPVAMPPAADGTFQVAGLREGSEYRVLLQGSPPAGFYVKSIRFGGDEVLTKPLRIGGAGSGTFEVTLRAGASKITGTLTDAQSRPVPGLPVVLIPSQRTRLDLTRSVPTDQDGHFSMSNVAPGEYKLFSWEAIDSGAYYDPEFLKQYEQQGKTVVVTESSNQQADVKMIPAQ